MLQFSSEVEKRTALNLGTVRQLVGTGGSVEFNARNFMGSSRLIVTLVKANGGKAKVICSPTVSKLFRKREMSLGELMSLSVYEEESKDGSIVNVIEMPESTDAPISFVADDIEETEFVSQPIAFVPEDRIAF